MKLRQTADDTVEIVTELHESREKRHTRERKRLAQYTGRYPPNSPHTGPAEPTRITGPRLEL